MPRLLQRLMPREEDFLPFFAKQAENIHAPAEALAKMLSHYTGVPEQVQSIKAVEHEGDEIAHNLRTKLNQTFITPFDREDIHELCSLINAAASRFVLYRVDSIRQGTIGLVRALVSTTVEVTAAVKALKHCIEINRCENESHRLCRTLIALIGAGLFHFISSPHSYAKLTIALAGSVVTLADDGRSASPSPLAS